MRTGAGAVAAVPSCRLAAVPAHLLTERMGRRGLGAGSDEDAAPLAGAARLLDNGAGAGGSERYRWTIYRSGEMWSEW